MLTANYEYSRSNKENLQLRYQIKLSGKPSTFCNIILPFLKSILNLQCSQKKKKPHHSSMSEGIESERCAYLNA